MAKFMMAAMGIDSKYEDLYVCGFHLHFEKADKNNDTAFFHFFYTKDELVRDFMLLHIEKTRGVFEWKNFDRWLKGFKFEEEYIKKFNEEKKKEQS